MAFASDLLIAALLLGGIYEVNYRIPQKGIITQTMTAQVAGVKSQIASEDEKIKPGNSSDTGAKGLPGNQESTQNEGDSAGGGNYSADNQAREKNCRY